MVPMVRRGARSTMIGTRACRSATASDRCSSNAMSAATRRRSWPPCIASRRWRDVRESRREKATPKRSAEDTRRYLLSIWHECRPISGTPAERYLRSRGIALELPPSLQFHPAQKHTDVGALLPCMMAAVQAPDRGIFGLHRTYLRGDGADKALVSKPRKMLGRHVSGAVRLAAANSEIAIGEGIETCLSFQQARRIPSWAALERRTVRNRATAIAARGDRLSASRH